MKENKSWYVIYTKPKLEKKIVELLEKKFIPTYLPELNKVQYLFGKKRIVRVPLLPSLLFVFLCENEIEKVIAINGVSGILYKFQTPAVIKNKEVADMQRFLIEHRDVVISQVPLGYDGEDGVKKSIQLSDVFFEDHKAEEIFLPSLGYRITAKTKNIVLNKVA